MIAYKRKLHGGKGSQPAAGASTGRSPAVCGRGTECGDSQPIGKNGSDSGGEEKMGNNVGAGRGCRTKRDTYACFDKLPAPLRRALHDAVLDWVPFNVRYWLNHHRAMGRSEPVAIRRVLALIRSWDQQEVHGFGEHWPPRFGTYPHLAANATIMRTAPPAQPAARQAQRSRTPAGAPTRRRRCARAPSPGARPA